MRIISGKYGGRKFDSKIPSGVRPTLDSTKETIFNILENMIDFNGISVCDLFAGTGAFGIESLSRGAGYTDFVDKSTASVSLIKNIVSDKLQIDKNVFLIHKMDVLSFLSISDKKYDLVFADPPYMTDSLKATVKQILKYKILKDNGIFVLETSAFKIIPKNENLELLREKITGDTKVSFFKYHIAE